jgi:hypothetical protein
MRVKQAAAAPFTGRCQLSALNTVPLLLLHCRHCLHCPPRRSVTVSPPRHSLVCCQRPRLLIDQQGGGDRVNARVWLVTAVIMEVPSRHATQQNHPAAALAVDITRGRIRKTPLLPQFLGDKRLQRRQSTGRSTRQDALDHWIRVALGCWTAVSTGGCDLIGGGHALLACVILPEAFNGAQVRTFREIGTRTGGSQRGRRC